jgi:RHS repeat-associated protein
MPVTNYHTVNGEIIGETTTGSPRVDYLTDALGSVTATVNQSAQVVNTYRYTPYGSTLAKTGPGPDPAFGWVGTKGYRPTGNPFSNFYVRKRHADSATGRWPAMDPIRHRLRGTNGYVYARNRPAIIVDPSGLYPPVITNPGFPGVPPGTIQWPGTGGPTPPWLPNPPISVGYGPPCGGQNPPPPPYQWPGFPPPPGPGIPGHNCLGMSPGACYICLTPILAPYMPNPYIQCVIANEMCGSHVKCIPPPGGGGGGNGGGWIGPGGGLVGGSIVWPGDVGDFSDFDWCLIACNEIVGRKIYSPKIRREMCSSMCAYLRGSGCAALDAKWHQSNNAR